MSFMMVPRVESRIDKVALVFHPTNPCDGAVRSIVEWLLRRCEVTVEPGARMLLEAAGGMESIVEGVPLLEARPDLIVTFGGDGTLLNAVRRYHHLDVPFFGVNYGTLGFMTECELGNALETLERLFDGEGWLDERLMLETSVVSSEASEGERASNLAVNEVVVRQGKMMRPLLLEIHVDKELLSRVKADGVIVATPTGTTGYAYSAGGAIVHPNLRCMELCAIAPHSSNNRSIIIPDKGVVRITVASNLGEPFLAVDGNEYTPLSPGDSVMVRPSSRSVTFRRVYTHMYYRRLREKLHWCM